MTKYKSIHPFCSDFLLQCINLTEFCLFNRDNTKMFSDKLSLIKAGIMDHLNDCAKCKIIEEE